MFEMGKVFRNIILVAISALYLHICSALLLISIVPHPVVSSSSAVTAVHVGSKNAPQDNLKFQRRHVPRIVKITEHIAVSLQTAITDNRNSDFETLLIPADKFTNSFELNTSKERAPPSV